MMDYYEHIEDYINGNLSEDDMAAFKEQLDQDDELAQAVENFRVVDEALGILVEDDIRGFIAALEHEEDVTPSEPIKKTPGYKSYLFWLLFVSSIALFAYLYKSYYKINEGSRNDMLFATYYSDYLSPEVRGDSNQAPTLNLCNQGHKLMQEEKLEAAKAVFLESLQVENDCTDKSQWYLTLIYLKEGDQAAVDSLLNIMIEDKESPYKSRSIRIKKEL